MQRKSIPSRAFWIIIIGGMVTGMGNGSVFGAAMMCRSQAPRYGRKNGLSVPGSTGAINRTNFGANSYA
jgi:hypothetical protein